MTASDWKKILKQLNVKPEVKEKFLKHCKPKERKIGMAAKKWDTKAYDYKSEETYTLFDKTDIIIIATPTNTHYRISNLLIKHKPKLVICEKPFCSNIKEQKFIYLFNRQYFERY